MIPKKVAFIMEILVESDYLYSVLFWEYVAELNFSSKLSSLTQTMPHFIYYLKTQGSEAEPRSENFLKLFLVLGMGLFLF